MPLFPVLFVFVVIGLVFLFFIKLGWKPDDSCHCIPFNREEALQQEKKENKVHCKK